MDGIASLCVSAAEDSAPVRRLQAQPAMRDAYEDSHCSLNENLISVGTGKH